MWITHKVLGIDTNAIFLIGFVSWYGAAKIGDRITVYSNFESHKVIRVTYGMSGLLFKLLNPSRPVLHKFNNNKKFH